MNLFIPLETVTLENISMHMHANYTNIMHYIIIATGEQSLIIAYYAYYHQVSLLPCTNYIIIVVMSLAIYSSDVTSYI